MKTLLILFLFSFTLFVEARDIVRTMNVMPGQCLYIEGKKVCAMAVKSQVIVVDGMQLPLQQRPIRNNRVPVISVIEGKYNVCECDYSSVINEGYTVQKIKKDGNKTEKIFYKVNPNASACSCQIMNSNY